MSGIKQNNKETNNNNIEFDFSICHGDYYEYCYCRI